MNKDTKKAINLEYKTLYEHYKGLYEIAISQLEAVGISFGEEPTRKVIPIEWIEKVYCLKLGGLPLSISNMIDDWRKENENNSNS